MSREPRASAEVADEVEQLRARLEEIVERHPALVAHRDRAREEHAEAIAEGRSAGTVRKLARRGAELDEQVQGERRASQLLADRIEAARVEHEEALAREREVDYHEAAITCRETALAVRDRVLADAELLRRCGKAIEAFDAVVTAERMRLVEGEHRSGRPHAGIRIWAELGLIRLGASPLTTAIPVQLATLPDWIEEVERRAERKRAERQGEPAPETEPPEEVAEEVETADEADPVASVAG